jgi:hypothetical protein
LGWEIVLPSVAPLEVAARIAAAEFVATSSLHGLIFADALSTPAQLVSFSGGARAEPLFKYDDYSSIFGMEITPEVASNVLRELPDAPVPDRAVERTEHIAQLLDDATEKLHASARAIA